MTLRSTVEQEIGSLIQEHGRITFARFMHACLYSPRGGFYATASRQIGAHFGTSPTSHPAFGALIARQLEQMWHRLGAPAVFHVIEVGSGDGSLARSIVHACSRMNPSWARALCYVATDYAPRRPPAAVPAVDSNGSARGPMPSGGPEGRIGPSMASSEPAPTPAIRRVQAAGLRALRNIVGCILSNELIDNFPVHRFAIAGGRVKEIFVTLADGKFAEVLGEPSTPRIAERLAGLGLSLPEGYRGEVSLAIEDWTGQVAAALERGFVLTIDYGDRAIDLYSAGNDQGTLACFHRHAIGNDPYRHIGEQDITCRVDFTTLMRSGERHGLAAAGYISQREFLANLGFSAHLDALEAQGLSAARTALNRLAMMALTDPEQYGDLKVLAQAKGIEGKLDLVGFAGKGDAPLS